MDFKDIFWILMVPFLVCGFRVIPQGNSWEVSNTSDTTAKLFVIYPNPTQVIPNDLPDGDPLAGTDTVTIQSLMNSIFDDYNNINGAFIKLVDSNDPDYTTQSLNRTITIKDGSAIGLTSGGYAQQSWNGNKIDGCTIVFKGLIFEKAKLFTGSVTHEIGHCLGLHHPMDTVNSIMSYYHDQNKIVRLQIDDKMGLVYLYPTNPNYSKEEATYGFSCSRKPY